MVIFLIISVRFADFYPTEASTPVHAVDDLTVRRQFLISSDASGFRFRYNFCFCRFFPAPPFFLIYAEDRTLFSNFNIREETLLKFFNNPVFDAAGL